MIFHMYINLRILSWFSEVLLRIRQRSVITDGTKKTNDNNNYNNDDDQDN